MNDNSRSLIYAGLAVFFWSTIPTAFKIALGELGPGLLLLIASVTSVVILTIITIAEGSTGELLKSTRKDILNSSALALLNPFIYYLVLLKAYSLLPAQVAQPLNMIWPFIIVILSGPLLKQKIPARSYYAMIISFAGVYIVSSQGAPLSPGKSDPLGVSLALGSSILWALYFIFNLRDHRRESIKLLVNFIIASIYLLIFLSVTGGFKSVSLKGLASGIYVGIFEMGLTFYLWLRALKLARTSDHVSNLVFIAPFLSLLFISLILHEKIYITSPIGLVLIIGGILFANWKRRGSGITG